MHVLSISPWSICGEFCLQWVASGDTLIVPFAVRNQVATLDDALCYHHLFRKSRYMRFFR